MKHKIMVRDDVRCGQHSVVSRKVGITGERNVITQTRCPSASSVHTVLGHASRNDEVRDPCFLKFLLKRRFEEGVRFSLPNDGLAVELALLTDESPSLLYGSPAMPL